MATENTSQFMQKAGDYGLQELLEIMDELSQESTKKGLLTRQQKELSTLGIALYKSCHRCISIHSAEAKRLEASELWDDWVINWKDYSYSKVNERRQLREMVALAIAIVMQHEKQIELHLTAALDVGISIEQVFEIVPLVMLMDGAPTLSQFPRLLTCYEQYQKMH